MQLKGKCHSVMWPVVQKIWGRPVWPRHKQASVCRQIGVDAL